MQVDVLLGLQWGDEGKGKIVDVLSPKYDIVARFQGGPNAGHTLEIEGDTHVLHIIPSGIFHPEKENVIGNGVIVDPFILKNELDGLKKKGLSPEKNLILSCKAHLILPSHRLLDAAYESSKGEAKIGSTLKGIGPAYTDKTSRSGLRIIDLFDASFEKKYQQLKAEHFRIINMYNYDYKAAVIDGLSFEQYESQWLKAIEEVKKLRIVNTENYINQKIAEGRKILAEGAQGTLLDIDFGSYPYVTSSNTITAGVCSGLGIAPSRIGRVYGIVKSYCTRVGSGPFPTELHDDDGHKLREAGHEYGATTGRPRRCGWLDLNALNYALMLNGVTDLIVTKADVLSGFSTIKVARSYRRDTGGETREFDLDAPELSPVYDEIQGWQKSLANVTEPAQMPQKLQEYINYIEKKTATPVSILSVGADRSRTLIIAENLK
ncbi:MAG: adenylosuccinate synthase [Bacteroidales bacterium]|nr:adenylosuccinate synthase [Bacteroidales bacterium]MCF8332873.1 adenylosuccinate synthase [Bacteroidales bacterium]